MLGGIDVLVHRVREWPVASQQRARRNAMLAATACAARRAEREDVDDYLDALSSPPEPQSASQPEPLAHPHRAVRG